MVRGMDAAKVLAEVARRAATEGVRADRLDHPEDIVARMVAHLDGAAAALTVIGDQAKEVTSCC